MTTRPSLRRQLQWQIVPKVVLLLAILAAVLAGAFFITAEKELKKHHADYNHDLLTEINASIMDTSQVINNLAENDLLINSLVDFQKREEYLPLFFQSLKITEAPKTSLGFFDFDGDPIMLRDWENRVPKTLDTLWRVPVLDDGIPFYFLNDKGLIIAAPVLINDMPEGALVFYVESLKWLVDPAYNQATQILIDDQQNVLFSSKPSVHGEGIRLNPEVLTDAYTHTQFWQDFEVISFESLGSAYANILWLIPVLLMAIMATALGSLFGVRLAATNAATTLLTLKDSLEHSLDDNTDTQPQVPQDESIELFQIRNAFHNLVEKVMSLSLSNTKITNLINSMHEILVVIDDDGEIVLSNMAFTEFASQTNINTHQVRTLFDSPDDASEIQTHVETSYKTKDNQHKLISWRCRPFVNSTGRTEGCVFVGEDITFKRALETDLRIRTTAMDEATVSIVISDVTQPNTPLIYVNRAFTDLTGYAATEVLGKNCGMLQGVNTQPEKVQEIRDAIAASQPVEVKLINYRKDGTAFNNLLTLTPVKGENDQVKHYIGIQQDITMQEQTALYLNEAKHKAEESARLQSRFLASMSHEIRTPINGIYGMLQVIEKTQLTGEQRKYTGLASESTQNLLHIINDILDFSKIEAGHLSIENINFDLKHLLNSVYQYYLVPCDDKGVTLTLTTSLEGHQYVVGDLVRLRQVLENLLNNAVKFTQSGEIAIVAKIARTQDDKLVFTCSIKDSGIGINSDKLESIFNVFSQEDDSTTRKFGGTGLGLAICKQLTQLMNGDIMVVSKKGVGSKFKFWIELEEGKQQEVEKAARIKAQAKLSGNKPVVLVVEDNEINRIVATQHLQDFKVVTANNGVEAISALQNIKATIEVVLMDCQMPEMDGFVATRLIRDGEAGDKYKEVPIIALTANAMKGDKEICIECGMNDYVSKPFEAETLVKKVKTWIKSAESTTQH